MSNLVVGKYPWIKVIQTIIFGTHENLKLLTYAVEENNDGEIEITYFLRDETDSEEFTVTGRLYQAKDE